MESATFPSVRKTWRWLAGEFSLSYQDSVSGRCDAIGHYFQIAGSRFHAGRYINVGGRDARKVHCHAVVIVRAAVKNVPGADIGQTHNGVICGRLCIVSIGNRLRKAVEVAAVEEVGAASAEACHASDDKRLGFPIRIGGAGGCVDFDIAAAIGVEHLAGGKDEHPSVPGRVVWRVRCRWDLVQVCPIPLEEKCAIVEYARAGTHQHVAVR